MPPRKRELGQIGWNPDADSACRQMEMIVLGLNGVLIRRKSSSEKRFRRVRLPLNESERELRRLVEHWRLTGPNVRRLFDAEPALAAFSKRGQSTFYPSDGGRGYLEWTPSDVVDGVSPSIDVALDRFMMLITNPNWKTLAGPCQECGDYFLKKRNQPRSYCSVRCSSRATAIKAVKTKRERDHEAKVVEAQGLIWQWEKKNPRLDCKSWIARDVRFTRQWLSRAANKGELRIPVSNTISSRGKRKAIAKSLQARALRSKGQSSLQ